MLRVHVSTVVVLVGSAHTFAHSLCSSLAYEQISDFGLSKILQQKGDEHRKKSTAQVPEELIGSLLWAAPEVLKGERGTAAADVYVVRVQLPIDARRL